MDVILADLKGLADTNANLDVLKGPADMVANLDSLKDSNMRGC